MSKTLEPTTIPAPGAESAPIPYPLLLERLEAAEGRIETLQRWVAEFERELPKLATLWQERPKRV